MDIPVWLRSLGLGKYEAELQSVENFRTICWLRSRASRRMSWAYRSTVSLRLLCSSARVYRRMRPTHSSTTSSEMPRTTAQQTPRAS